MSNTVSRQSGQRNTVSGAVRLRASPHVAGRDCFLDARGNPSASFFARYERHLRSIFQTWLIVAIGLIALTFFDDGVSAQRRFQQQFQPADVYEQKRAEYAPSDTGVPDGGQPEATLATGNGDGSDERPSKEELDPQWQILVISVIQALTALIGLTGLGYTVWFAFKTWRK